MIIAVTAVLAVVAAVLAALLVAAKSSARADREAATERQSGLEAERDKLGQAIEVKRDELAARTAKVSELEASLADSRAEVAKLNRDLAETKEEVSEQSARIEKQLGQVADLITERSSLQSRLTESEAARAAAQARNVGMSIDRSLAGDDARAQALWDLELLRSQRMWRTSVATDPEARHTPFEDTDDPVRLAIEVEAAALREDVGSSVAVVWETDQVEDPGRSHLIVRVAQEMLEAAARCSEPSRLTVIQQPIEAAVDLNARGKADGLKRDDFEANAGTESGEAPDLVVTLQLSAIGDGPEDDLLNFIPPRITSELVDLRDETGTSFVIRSL